MFWFHFSGTCMVPTYSDGSKLRIFQGPHQDQISFNMDFYGEFHNANELDILHIYLATCCWQDFGTQHLSKLDTFYIS